MLSKVQNESCSCHLDVALVMFGLDRNLLSTRENMTYETVNSLLL